MTDLFTAYQTNLDKVKEILERHPQSRDSDKYLYLIYLRDYTNSLNYLHDFNSFINCVMDSDIATPETLSRIRRKLQSKGEYLGTKQKERQNERQNDVKQWVRDNA